MLLHCSSEWWEKCFVYKIHEFSRLPVLSLSVEILVFLFYRYVKLCFTLKSEILPNLKQEIYFWTNEALQGVQHLWSKPISPANKYWFPRNICNEMSGGRNRISVWIVHDIATQTIIELFNLRLTNRFDRKCSPRNFMRSLFHLPECEY